MSVESFSRRRSRMNTPEYYPEQSALFDDVADWDYRAGQVPRGRNSLAGFAVHPQASQLHHMMAEGGPWSGLAGAGAMPHPGLLEPEGQDAATGVPGGRRASYGRRHSLQSIDDDDVLAQACYRPRLRTDSNFGFPTAPHPGLPPSLPAGAAAWSGSSPYPGLPGMPPNGLGMPPHYPGLVPGVPPPAVWPGGYPYSLPPHLAAHQQPAFLQPPTPYVNLQHGLPPQQRWPEPQMWGPQGRGGRSDPSYGAHYPVNHSAGAAAAAHGAAELPTGPKTTLMLQNLPDRFTRDMLINLLNREGFAGQYDFAYLPVAFDTMQGLNHAFINMCNPDSAEVFQDHFNGFKGWPVPSEKVCVAAWHDRQQGLAPLIERYRNSPVMHESVPDECKPLIFQGGRPVEFPAPTQKIKPPKALKQTAG